MDDSHVSFLTEEDNHFQSEEVSLRNLSKQYGIEDFIIIDGRREKGGCVIHVI